MPDFLAEAGAVVERAITVRLFVVVALPLLGVITYRHWPKTNRETHALYGRAYQTVLGVAGVGLSLRLWALCAQGEISRAVERVSDLERGGMIVLFAFATGFGGVAAFRNAFSSPRRAPPFSAETASSADPVQPEQIEPQ